MKEPREGVAGGRTIVVSVALKGPLASRFPAGRSEVEVPDGTVVGELIEVLDLPRSPCVFVIRGAMVDRQAPLSDGDRVQIYPPVAGG